MAATKSYKMGKRLIRYRNILYVLASLVIFCFYFIYDYVMVPAFTWLDGAPLVAIFLLVEAVMIVLVRWGADKILNSTTYRVTDEALEIQIGKNTTVLPWKDFEEAAYKDMNFRAQCPVTYTIQGKSFLPNQYLDGLWTMNQEIVNHIRPYAKIEEGLERKLSAFA